MMHGDGCKNTIRHDDVAILGNLRHDMSVYIWMPMFCYYHNRLVG